MKLAARMQKKLWNIKNLDADAGDFGRRLGVAPVVAQVLINREITDPEQAALFLKPKLTELIAPENMPGVQKAVEIIKNAVLENKKITIYGDYDVDGITSVSILTELLNLLNAEVDFYIPHRLEEGYGLNKEAVEAIAKAGTQLLVTVDCGISAFESVKLAKELGMEIVVTDHHQPGAKLPAADAIVHPTVDEEYANPHSCGAMVAFKLAWAVANQFSNGSRLDPTLRDFMINATSLAAMGTVADVMDLRAENRILTHFGLKSLPQCKLPGIQALIETANLTDKNLDSFDIGFKIAPMLNAAGRLGHARLAVELLTCQNTMRAYQIAEYLSSQNSQRQQIERKILKHACQIINESGMAHPDRKTIVLSGENWHTGVVGIVASRIVDKFYRPTIILNATNGTAQGSARSIPGFDLLAAIEACSEHLTTFGGHKMAAGLTLATEKIEAFAADLEKYAQENLKDDEVVDTLDIDAAVSLRELSMNTVSDLQNLGPFGQGNPKPVFATKGLRLASTPRKVGAKGDHLQLAVTDNTATVRCIGFGMGKLEKKLLESEFFSLAYEPDINTYNGHSNVQLVVTDVNFD